MRRITTVLSSQRRGLWMQARSQPGQFGVPGLHTPTDWSWISSQCVAQCEAAAERIRQTVSSPSIATLQLFDDLSNDICCVLDAAELCRNVHPNPEFVRAADDAYSTVSRVTVALNADQTLYEPLLRLRESKTPMTDEQQSMLLSLLLDFERGGINLHDAERTHVSNLQNRANVLGATFASNAASATSFVEVERSKLSALPGYVLNRLDSVSGHPGKVLLPAGDSVVGPLVMKYVSDRDIRRRLYIAEHSRCADPNLSVLDELLGCRLELARMLGSEGYAHLMFGGRLASSPEDVMNFLSSVSEAVRPIGAIEVGQLSRRKQAHEGLPRPSQVDAWDRSMYMGMVKAEAFELDAQTISEFLPLHACLSGLSAVVRAIFGVSMRAVPQSDCVGELWHPDVQKVELLHEVDGVIGYMFLDLFSRDDKYGHAAHFNVRCGCNPENGPTYQEPVVALVCNFSRSVDTGVALLSFSEYETLWHEFGHVLHSVLSRTKYQHLSGTRVATDLVEIPSHLCEYFAWDARVLAQVARHFHTGDPMPSRTVQAIAASRHQFFASELESQLLYANLDLLFHGKDPPIGHTTAAAAGLQNQLTSVEHVTGTASHTAFHHFVGYGGGYYSYVYARVIASQIWAKLFAKDPLSRAAGEAIRHSLLGCGASRDPPNVISDLLGKDAPSCEALFLEACGGHSEDRPFGEIPLVPVRASRSSHRN